MDYIKELPDVVVSHADVGKEIVWSIFRVSSCCEVVEGTAIRGAEYIVITLQKRYISTLASVSYDDEKLSKFGKSSSWV